MAWVLAGSVAALAFATLADAALPALDWLGHTTRVATAKETTVAVDEKPAKGWAKRVCIEAPVGH
jgi:hypothetical protein